MRQEMLADDTQVVLTGPGVRRPAALRHARGPEAGVHRNPVTTPDFLAKDGFAFTPGSPGVIQGMAIFAATMLPEGKPAKAAVVYSANPAEVAYTLLTKPIRRLRHRLHRCARLDTQGRGVRPGHPGCWR